MSVAVPCYNEEAGLPEFYRRLSVACREAVGDDYEIILVNDGSRDGTWKTITSLTEADPHVLGVNLTRNFGHQAALTCALSLCEGERIFMLDADLQDPPELLGPMMAAMDAGADVAFGKRRSRAGETHPKKISAKFFYWLLRQLTDFEIPSDTGDFRLMSRRVLDALLSLPESSRFIRGMVSWVGYQQVPIAYDRQSRFAGKTSYTFGKMVSFALDAITAFSVRPFRLALYAGAALLLASVVGLGYWLFALLSKTPVPSAMPFVLTTAFLGSAQIFMLGLLGEYVSRTLLQTKARPLYVVSELAGTARRAVPETVPMTGSASL